MLRRFGRCREKFGTPLPWTTLAKFAKVFSSNRYPLVGSTDKELVTVSTRSLNLYSIYEPYGSIQYRPYNATFFSLDIRHNHEYTYFVNMFAAGVGSIPTITEAMIVNFVSFICSGIAYDVFKALFLEGVSFMKIFIVMITSWLGCYGYVV